MEQELWLQPLFPKRKNICNFPIKVIPKSNDCLIVDKIEDKITLEGSFLIMKEYGKMEIGISLGSNKENRVRYLQLARI